jgi:Fe-S-cluster containining protein
MKLDPALIQLIRPDRLRGTGERVMAFQKVDGACPLFNRMTKLCNIYEKRPITCRIFPWIVEMKGPYEFEMKLSPFAPCPAECFDSVHPILPAKEIAKLLIRGIVLQKRENLAEKVFQKENEQFLASLGSEHVEKIARFHQRLVEGDFDLEDHLALDCKSGERLLTKRWAVCENGEIVKKLNAFNADQDNVREDEIPDDLSTVVGDAPIGVMVLTLFNNGDFVGIELWMRRPDTSELEGADSLSPAKLLGIRNAKIAGTIPEQQRKDTNLIEFQEIPIDLSRF